MKTIFAIFIGFTVPGYSFPPTKMNPDYELHNFDQQVAGRCSDIAGQISDMLLTPRHFMYAMSHVPTNTSDRPLVFATADYYGTGIGLLVIIDRKTGTSRKYKFSHPPFEYDKIGDVQPPKFATDKERLDYDLKRAMERQRLYPGAMTMKTQGTKISLEANSKQLRENLNAVALQLKGTRYQNEIFECLPVKNPKDQRKSLCVDGEIKKILADLGTADFVVMPHPDKPSRAKRFYDERLQLSNYGNAETFCNNWKKLNINSKRTAPNYKPAETQGPCPDCQ